MEGRTFVVDPQPNAAGEFEVRGKIPHPFTGKTVSYPICDVGSEKVGKLVAEGLETLWAAKEVRELGPHERIKFLRKFAAKVGRMYAPRAYEYPRELGRGRWTGDPIETGVNSYGSYGFSRVARQQMKTVKIEVPKGTEVERKEKVLVIRGPHKVNGRPAEDYWRNL